MSDDKVPFFDFDFDDSPDEEGGSVVPITTKSDVEDVQEVSKETRVVDMTALPSIDSPEALYQRSCRPGLLERQLAAAFAVMGPWLVLAVCAALPGGYGWKHLTLGGLGVLFCIVAVLRFRWAVLQPERFFEEGRRADAARAALGGSR